MTKTTSDEAPSIETDRLWLSSFTMEDVEAVFAYASNPAVSRHTTWAPHTGKEEAAGFIQYARGERYCWAIRLRSDGPAVGAIECTDEEPGQASIHYVLAEEHWGQGIMTEAARAVMEWAFASNLHLQRITTTVIEEHAASRRVLEKCGMGVVGHVSETWKKSEEPVKLALYGVTRGEWGRPSS